MTDETVFVVDDDDAVRDSLVVLLNLQGYRTRAFPHAEAFLEAYSADWHGCVLLDLRMPGMSGLELQHAFDERGIALPIVMITAHGDVAAARASFKAGVVDFLEKPLDNAQLVHAVSTALLRARMQRESSARASALEQQLARLTERERQVLELIVAGRHNREIAVELGISARTVEVHKARVMTKLGVDRLTDLVRMMSAGGSS